MGIRRTRMIDGSVNGVYGGRIYDGKVPHDVDYPKLKDRGLGGGTGLGKIDSAASQPQDRESRAVSLNDVPEGSWLRGGAGPAYPGGLDRGLSGRRCNRRSEKD